MTNSPEVALHRKFPAKTPRVALGFKAYGAELWRQAAVDSLRKFDPRTQIRNPVMLSLIHIYLARARCRSP